MLVKGTISLKNQKIVPLNQLLCLCFKFVCIDKRSIIQQGTHNQLMNIYKYFVDSRKQAVSWKLVH